MWPGTWVAPTSARARVGSTRVARRAQARSRTPRPVSSSASRDSCERRSRSSVCLLWLRADERGHAVYPAAPQRFVLVEEPPSDTQPLEVRADNLAPPPAFLRDEARPLQDRDVLLDRCEAHGVVLGQLGHAFLPFDRAAHDVAPCRVGQRAKHAVEVGWSDLHNTTIRLYKDSCQPPARAPR